MVRHKNSPLSHAKMQQRGPSPVSQGFCHSDRFAQGDSFHTV